MPRESGQQSSESTSIDGKLTRRRWVQALGAGGALGLAGCQGKTEQPTQTTTKADDNGDDDTNDQTTQSKKPIDGLLTTASNPNMPFDRNSWGMNGYNPKTRGGGIGAWSIERFMSFNPQTGEFVPRIAEGYSVSGDTMTVTFSDEYGWGSGDPVTAKDFVTKIKVNKGMGYSVGDLFDSAEATSDTEAKVTLSNPGLNQKILGFEFLIGAASTPHAVYDQYVKDFADASSEEEMKAVRSDLQSLRINPWQHGIPALHKQSSGAFRMKEYNNSRVILEANPNHPASDTINFDAEFRIVRDTNAIMSLLQSDETDIQSWGLSQTFLDSLPDNHDAWITPKFGGNAIMFRMDADIFGNPGVRKALAYAVDNSKLSRATDFVTTPVTQYTGMPDAVAKSYIPDDKLSQFTSYDQDFDKAAESLRSAGFSKEGGTWYKPDGDKWNLNIPVDSNSQDRIKQITVVVSELKKMGVNANIEVADASTYWKRYRQSDWDVATWAFGERWNPLPYYDFKFLYSGENSGSSWNHLTEIDVQAPYPVGDPNGDMRTVDLRQKIRDLQKASGDRATELITELGWIFNQNMFLMPITHETRQHVLTDDHWNYPSKDEFNGSRYGVQYRAMFREGKFTAKTE